MPGSTRYALAAVVLGVVVVVGLLARRSDDATGPSPPTSVGHAASPVHADPDLGPNVYVFGPETEDFGAIDARFATLRDATTGQFSTDRVAFLFKPGAYEVDIPVGFYTTVHGLGRSPEDVTITGDVRSDAVLEGGNSTCNFWRGVENFTVVPTVEGRMKWAVAQATPFRRMHVQGDLVLADTGPKNWASGGFIASSRIDGQVRSWSQQQWLTRSSRISSWTGSVWNMAFVGVEGAPDEDGWSREHPFTVVGRAPVIAEKPFLCLDEGAWSVFVPAPRVDTRGYDWATGERSGRMLPLSAFHIAKAGVDDASTLNAALAAGKHLLLTPGVYPVDRSVRVQRPGTVVLGLGFATLVPQDGAVALQVADVDGVRISGVMIDAGTRASPVLMEVGPPGSSASHTDDPTVLHDLVIRVGNGAPGAADTALAIHSSDVVGDHLWLWVADHDAHTFPLPWKTNPARNGLVVSGDRVTAYGLFVEHFQEHMTVWNGEDGRVYLYQSELPYNADATWSSGPGVGGYASYKVGESVQRHQAWAVGIYMVFGAHPCSRAVEAPERPGVRFVHLMTAGIATGSIENVINSAGGGVRPGQTAYLAGYP